MGLFGKGRAARMLSPACDGAMIERHACGTFAASDALRLPAGWEAILVRDGAFSQVLREGDDRLPIEGRRKVEGELYFIRIAPDESFGWGCGGVRIGSHTCGLHGFLRMEVVSSRKLLSAFMGEPLPLTAERAFDRLLDSVLDAVGNCARQVVQATGTFDGVEAQIAGAARRALEEPFERYGLAIAQLTLEGLFVAPDAQEV